MSIRLDSFLVDKGYAPSREKAKELIISGKVFVDNIQRSKPSFQVDECCNIEIKGEVLKYVSRGGLKLEKVINEFSIDLTDKICADIGASTGGFTDCMLQNGCNKVYAVDVGHSQLAPSLVNDKRVINIENVNARYISNDDIPEKVDFISVDVSFISLTLVLPAVKSILKDNGAIACLIKPQFEAGKQNVGKKGVVKSQSAHKDVIEKIYAFSQSIGLNMIELTFSPIKGPEGNIEYITLLSNNIETPKQWDFKAIAAKAFNNNF